MACILEFGLDKKPPVLDRPLIAKCTVELVPSWIPPTGGPYQVLLPTELAKATHTIYQVSAFEPIASPEVEEKRLALWKKSKATNPDFCAGVTIVLLDFEIRGDPERVVVSVPISDTMIGIVKEGAGFTHSVGSEVRRKPYSVPSCFSVLNHHIRSDEGNELGLRLPISVEFRPILRVD
ncbi:hypothetical protein BDN70DRAFT_995201 [Pholiota conissans]|uniref:Uncharacterized protein n=1 Tax=Pholiota conissans TaxID=109636 RepID=A0A9P5YX62_9AGAR|nr:hypothetical protein BDN70DRAFT_995201 [Pholiota conissans]